MRTPEVAGIPLNHFEDPLRIALDGYVIKSGGDITFGDIDQAARLKPAPEEKSYSARSSQASPVYYQGERAGELVVVVFGPGEGSGDENTFRLDEVTTTGYPHIPAVVPRTKKVLHSEFHLPLATRQIDAPHDEPRLFAGRLSLLGFPDPQTRQLGEIGMLGNSLRNFRLIMRKELVGEPIVTSTVWDESDGEGERRGGDPHAVWHDRVDVVQACAFVALPAELRGAHADNIMKAWAACPARKRLAA